ncbi:MAG: hypothetical protein JW729_06155, partial [Bacteroidales bacterium]|nr:hypothetical protein [Bacteroidales bacterium]
YRFGFQGQFAEEDPETGYTAFESRLLDKRLGRWLTTDPAGQFWSPYLAMGNNPINGVDPDGEKWYESTSNPGTFEWFTGWQSFKAFMSSDWSMTPRGGTTTNFGSGWTTTAEPVTITGSIPNMVKSPWGGMMLNPVKFGNYNPGTISQYVPNFFGRIEESTLGQTFVGKAVYGVVDDAYVYSTSFIYGPSGARHLNRSGVVGSELQDAGISTLTNFVPIGKMGSALGIGKKTLNAGQFNALYKGSGITAATGGGVQIRAYNQAIRTHTGFQKAFTWFGIGTTAVGATQK